MENYQMQNRKTGAENKMSGIRLVIALLAVCLLVPYAACTNSGIGGYGQPCSKFGVCVDSLENVDDPEHHVICCPNTSTCITELECYDSATEIPRGGENELCNEDGSCDSDLVCCSKYTPAICVAEFNCIDEDGDKDGDVDDDVEMDGDYEIESSEDESEEEIPVTFPETYNGSVCTDSQICWEMPWPTVHNLNSIVEIEDRILIVGNSGTIINSDKETFDGQTGVVVDNLNDVAASGERAWAVGANMAVLGYDGENWSKVTDAVFTTDKNRQGVDLNAVFDDGTSVFVVGDSSNLFKYSADKWTALGSPTAGTSFNDVWSVDGEITVIVGDGGLTIISYDQTSFAADPRTSNLTEENLNSVWGIDKDNVLVVGNAGKVLYFDGTGWVDFSDFVKPVVEETTEKNKAEGDNLPELSAETNNFNAVAGLGKDAIFVVGDNGTVYKLVEGANPRYRVINELEEGGTEITVEDPTKFYQTHYWQLVTVPNTENLTDVVVTKVAEVYVAGENGTIWATASGEEWSMINRMPPRIAEPEDDKDFYRCTALNGLTTTVYVAYSDGSVGYMDTSKDNKWVYFDDNTLVTPVNDIWVNTDGKPYFFNDEIRVYSMSGSGLNLSIAADDSIVGGVMVRAWGFGDGSMYAVGEGVIHYDSTSWSRVTDEVSSDWSGGVVDGDVDIESMEDELELEEEIEDEVETELEEEIETELEVEEEAEVEQSTKQRLRECSLGDDISCYKWNAVWGKSPDNPWLVGDLGLVANRIEDPNDENKYIWRTQTVNGNVNLTDIWGDDSDDIWVTGTLGTLWHYDGTSFDAVNIDSKESDEDFTRVWGVSSNQVFVLSNLGNIYYTADGANFTQYQTGVNLVLDELWGSSVNSMYFGGENGTVLKAMDAFTAEKKAQNKAKK